MARETLDLFSAADPKHSIDVRSLLDLGCPGYLLPTVFRLSTPQLIQGQIDTLTYLHDDDDRIVRALPGVLETGQAHCFDGTIGVAVPLLHIWGYKPQIVLINAIEGMDVDHNVAVFRLGDRLGAVAMSSFPTLKYRPPIYPSLQDLMQSFYPYYTSEFPGCEGQISMRGYTAPIRIVEKYGTGWFFRRTGDQALMDIYHTYTQGAMCTDILTGERYPYPEE